MPSGFMEPESNKLFSDSPNAWEIPVSSVLSRGKIEILIQIGNSNIEIPI